MSTDDWEALAHQAAEIAEASNQQLKDLGAKLALHRDLLRKFAEQLTRTAGIVATTGIVAAVGKKDRAEVAELLEGIAEAIQSSADGITVPGDSGHVSTQ